jgi:hypothetical protein
MQTFLPYPDFTKSARCLDRQRLGKQRVEVLQLLRALLVPGSGWANHPAAKMWRGREGCLAAYGVAICQEWKRRGYKDTCEFKIITLADPSMCMPLWLGDPAFHASHRSNLLRKDADHYGQFGWTEPSDLPYVWPV